MTQEKQILKTPKEVMEAFLAGKRLQNDCYSSDDCWLYLSATGMICEEDGAGAKAGRVPISMREDERWWVLHDLQGN